MQYTDKTSLAQGVVFVSGARGGRDEGGGVDKANVRDFERKRALWATSMQTCRPSSVRTPTIYHATNTQTWHTPLPSSPCHGPCSVSRSARLCPSVSSCGVPWSCSWVLATTMLSSPVFACCSASSKVSSPPDTHSSSPHGTCAVNRHSASACTTP